MKLLLCPICGDVRKLHTAPVSCVCGAATGRYLADGHHAEHSGGHIIGIDNHSLLKALRECRANPRIDARLMTDNPRVREVPR